MGLVDRIRKFAKNTAICTTLLGAILLGTTSAQEPQKSLENTVKQELRHPKRTLLAELAKSPLEDYDANAKAWHSVNQLFGKGSDLLGIDCELDKNVFGRIGQLAVMYYVTGATGYYSHEIAHEYEGRKVETICSRLDFAHWHGKYPDYLQAIPETDSYYDFIHGPSEKTERIYIRGVVGGLNQEELNAYMAHKESTMNKNLTFDEAFSFLLPKSGDVKYILIWTKGGLNHNADYKSINVLNSSQANYADGIPTMENQGMEGDIDLFLHHLNRKGMYRAKQANPKFNWWDPINHDYKGIELTKKELLTQALIADAFSTKTFDCVRALYNYLVNGERSTKPTIIHLGRTEITPPLISHYLTKDGSYYDTNLFVNITGKALLEANLGTDVDFIGHGNVRHLRTGGQLSTLNENINIRPFFFINSTRGKIFAYKGISTGVEIAVGLPDTIELMGKMEYNQNDMMENDVKGKEEGIGLSAGIRIQY